MRDKVDILVVDDKPDKLLSLEAVLEQLGENVVTAASGREALRHLLRQPFALILLDINMPGMDGFETAALIRQHRQSKQTPIIFMTAAGDDALLNRSYALGAVDYILTPVIPQVLLSKVRVFCDLHRKTEEVQRQAAALGEHSARLQRLADASLAINSMLSLDAILQAITDGARRVIGAHQAMTTVVLASGRPRGASSFSDTYAAFHDHRPGRTDEALYLLAEERWGSTPGPRRPREGTVRLTQAEIDADPDLRIAAEESGGPPRRGFLAAPITERDGRVLGIVQVSDRARGDFTDGDEAALVQLAQLASVAIQNCVYAEAREANRLKDEFLATLSHELRTPLHALLGWTRLLRTGTPDPARINRGLEVIERNVNLQTSLIDGLLDVSRITSGKLRIDVQRLHLGPVLEAAVDALRPTADAKSIQIRTQIEEEAPQVLGDAERLHQVFTNLVGNAVKFTPKGGRVEASLRRRRHEGGPPREADLPSASRFAPRTPEDDVEIRVSDTGEGIGPEFLPFVFDRFRQADSSITRAHGGLGLGLSVVRHLVELHGGAVRAESQGLGKGATFVVLLPALPPAAVRRSEAAITVQPREMIADPDHAPVSGVQTLDGLRVLVVDDDEDARELLREVLLQHRAHVTTAGSAREALDAMAAARPHVLVSDIAMKGEDGYDLIRRIRVRAPHEGGLVPALALTAHIRKEDRLRALEAGFQMHATKPIEPVELVAAIAALAGTGVPTPRTG
jgi:signal transduction histidine kinase/DNA-binding response OmpR family regulator